MPRSVHILIVDDQPSNLKVARGLLSNICGEGVQIDTADGGEQGVAKAVQKPYDLIFMDCRMPGVDGGEATRRIRAAEQQSGKGRVPVIALTAEAQDQAQSTCDKSELDDVLHKPVVLQTMLEKLQKHLPNHTWGEGFVASATEQDPIATDPLQSDTAIHRDDVEGAMAQMGLPPESYDEVAEVILEQVPELLDPLHDAIEHAHFTQARELSHVLKGSMVNVLFPSLAGLALTMHKAIRAEDQEQALDFYQQLVEAYGPILDALRARLA
ncbi:response regulator [Magnetococcus sp. PR-3]|uniref:response regulator n=1 Tax=Magnetococcus sp. PR-3 TaxID=3120355 RepID=UPI002FCDF4C4